jgi:hypothetical protein
MGKWVRRACSAASGTAGRSLPLGARLGLGVFVCLAAVLVASGGTKAAPRRVATNSVTFQDSLNENPSAPDIDKVTVSNDDTGIITFQIAITNRPQLVSPMEITVFIDSDQNSSDGAGSLLAGADLMLDLVPGDVALGRWNGSDFTFGSSPSSLTYSYSNGIATIRVNASDLQLTTFNFIVGAAGDQNDENTIDIAPDPGHGAWPYTVKITPPPPPPSPPTTTTTTKPPTKKKALPLCKAGHKSTKAHPCRKK